MSLLRDYSNQARTYDETRAASPSVLGPLREALAGAPGPRLVDVGGGTGNYARALQDEGWEPLVVDREPAMLARAAAKGLETLLGDAQRLPLPDACADAVMLVSMLHHVEDQPAAIAEARRILRPRGRLVLMVFTREDLSAAWMSDYFVHPRARARDGTARRATSSGSGATTPRSSKPGSPGSSATSQRARRRARPAGRPCWSRPRTDYLPRINGRE